MIDQYDEIQAQNEQSNMEDSVNPFQLRRNPFLQSPYKKLQDTLNKQPQYRNMNDIKTISKFINESQYLLKLAQRTSLDLVKHIIKNGKIYDFNKRQWICEKGTKLTFIFIILEGKVVTKTGNSINPLYLSLQSKDLISSPKQKKSRLLRKSSLMQPQLHQLKSPQLKKKRGKRKANDAQFNTTQKVIQNGLLYGQQLLNENIQWYPETLVCQTAVKILGIRRQDYIEVYSHFVKKKKADLRTLFRTACSSFQFIEDDRLNEIIKRSQIVTYRKDQFIFKQGQQPQYFYILTKGQVKLMKIVDLFKENPNTLYIDRQSLFRQPRFTKKGTDFQKKNSLPYADFTSLYNYRPQIKQVQLGIISPISLLGQQQIFENIPRQISVKALTTSATMYKLSLETMIECLIGGQNKSILASFRQNLYENLTKKRILYRQNKLAQILQVQNKNNMKYFYLNEDQQSSKNNNTKKSDMNKFQDSLSPKKVQTARNTSQSKTMYNPQFNQFNFTKMLFKENQQEDCMAKSMTIYERKIAGLTHTVRNISEQVKMTQSMVKQLNKPKQLINIHNPLFNQQFLQRKNIDVTRQQLANRKINQFIRRKCHSSQQTSKGSQTRYSKK